MLPSPATMEYSISLLVPASRSVADIPEKTVVPTGADCNANKNNNLFKQLYSFRVIKVRWLKTGLTSSTEAVYGELTNNGGLSLMSRISRYMRKNLVCDGFF